MAKYALGSWNASLILDPKKTIKKKILVLIFQTKLFGALVRMIQMMEII